MEDRAIVGQESIKNFVSVGLSILLLSALASTAARQWIAYAFPPDPAHLTRLTIEARKGFLDIGFSCGQRIAERSSTDRRTLERGSC
jgi:hypothetical protein